MAKHLWLTSLLLLASPGGAPPEDTSAEQHLIRLSEHVFHDRCPKRLLGDRRFPFREAEIACAAFLSGAIEAHVALHGSSKSLEQAVEGLVRVALSSTAMEPFMSTGWSRVHGVRLPKSVLYRGWLAYIFEMRERTRAYSRGGVGASLQAPARTPLHHALMRELSSELDQGRFLPSFGKARYPCDHAPALAAMTLYGNRMENEELSAAAAGLRSRLSKLLESGFPSAVGRTGAPTGPVRGTPLAFSAAFLQVADPELASRFAAALFEGFCEPALVSGCAEYRDGDGPIDSASGPTIAGVSVGTTALALAASGAAPDDRVVPGLWRTAALAQSQFKLDPAKAPLELAILAFARTHYERALLPAVSADHVGKARRAAVEP